MRQHAIIASVSKAIRRLAMMAGSERKQSGAMAVHGSVSPSPIRVLVNAVHARAGGGITYLRHLLPLLAAEPDLEIHVIPHPSQAQTFAAPGIRLHHQRLPASWAALLVWEQAVLPLLARCIGCDLLVSAANFGPLLARRQVIVMQAPLTVGALERRFRKKLYWATLRLMTRLSLSRARRAIAVSRHLAVGAPHRRPPTVIHYGLDPVFSPGPATPSEPPFLLAVSDFYLHKNLHRLVEAFALIRRGHPAITLRIAGAAIDADYAASIGERIAALGLTDAVLLLGSRGRAELLALYRSCAVFVFPSLEETFGLPLVEAMACGAPVVSAARSVMPEIAGGAALEVDPEDPSAIADAVLRILGDPSLAAELRRRGVERAKAFSWEECARRTAAVLREAAGREAAPSAA